MVEERAAATHFDKRSSLGCLTMVAAVILALVGLELDNAPLLIAGGAILGLALLMTLFWLATDAGRFARTHAVPLLVRGLRPFQPAPHEVEGAIQEVRAAGLRIGKKVRPAHLIAALQVPPQPDADQSPMVPR